ncbi:MAG: alpha/beta fold hydrolase [Actinomycetota bacterium]|nr:alpha/beta fold hydrolase [Actinomycetota bacterium]
MRACEPDLEGYVGRDGVKVGYEVFGFDREPTLLLLPTWMIVHSRCWKAQVPSLARHYRVITLDPPGNGRSDRARDAAAYSVAAQTARAVEVLDATGTDQAVLVSLSAGSMWALDLMAHHAERVLGGVFITPAVPLARKRHVSVESFLGPYPDLPESSTRLGGRDPDGHWAKFNRAYWQDHYEDFLWFFFGRCFTEPHSSKQIEDCVAWGLETSDELLAIDAAASNPDEAVFQTWAEAVRDPVLVVHGSDDAIVPLANAEALADATGGSLTVIEGAGHLPLAREPVKVNLLLRDFVERVRPEQPRRRCRWTRGGARPRRVLYVSSPIGLGHALRDVAIGRALRRHHPDAQVDWLAQHPVTRVLQAAGERIHPASAWLASESAHIETESAEHDLHAFQAIRRMDEILLANFMVFHELTRDGDYDLVVGDEAWDVDYFLHENPELKRFAYAWLTDFVGWLPMPDGDERERYLTADYNAEMIGQIARYPRVRDRAVFVGQPEDVVANPFGPDLPRIRDWTEMHYDFSGYVTGFGPAVLADREALRAELGYHPGERVCIVTVGGSGVGGALLRRVIAAYPGARRRVDNLRMIVVAGPRIDPDSLPRHEGLEVRPYVDGLYRHLAACDLAVVQGGLTTCMELTATRRPFIYFPLGHHFEQNFHVAHRLKRHGAGRRMDYTTATPEVIADAIASEIGREVHYRPVETDGAARAAALLAELL